jgi:hypothetical protein
MSADEDIAHHNLCRLARGAFERGIPVDDALTELGLPAMQRGIDLVEAEQIIRAQYQLCSERESDEQTLERLSRLATVRYEQLRKSEALRLRIRPGALDAEVAKRRNKSKTTAPTQQSRWAPIADTWPEPVNGAVLVIELTVAIQRFVVMDGSSAQTVALWVLFTWVFEQVSESNPFLRIISPVPGCGKSTLLKVLMRLVRSGWLLSRITPSAFSRAMQTQRRTLLLDEGDAFLIQNEIMRNLLDGASDPDTASVSMSIKVGDDWTPVEFNGYVPIAIASIGLLRKMQTVEDRSIVIHLKRATSEEMRRLSKGRRRELSIILEPLAQKCARWAADNLDRLKGARPDLPDALSGREQDKWEPLIAIADAIGEQAGTAARSAALAASTTQDGEDRPILIALLGDIRKLFQEKSADKMSSKMISEELAMLEGHPWAEYGRAQKPISQNKLAGLLRNISITPHTIQLSDKSTAKGYEKRDFEDAFQRYLPQAKNNNSAISGDPNRQNVKPIEAVGESSVFQSVNKRFVDGSKNGSSPYAERDFDVLTDGNAGDEAERPLFETIDEAEVEDLE